MSEWEDFITKCPSCDNKKIIHWEHCKGYGEKINKYGEVKCLNPNCPLFLKPKFIMDKTFDCGNHEGRHPNLINAFNALGLIHLILNLTKNERRELFMRLNSYDEESD